MEKENWWINNYKVTVKLDDKVVCEKTVRSKATRTAITNVLTNHYTGDMTSVEVEQLTQYSPKMTAEERNKRIRELTRPHQMLTMETSKELRLLLEEERKHQYELGFHDAMAEEEESKDYGRS